MDYENLGLTKDEQELVSLADEMASAMTNMNSHNYDTFITARDRFRMRVRRMVDKQKVLDDRLAKIKAAIEAA